MSSSTNKGKGLISRTISKLQNGCSRCRGKEVIDNIEDHPAYQRQKVEAEFYTGEMRDEVAERYKLRNDIFVNIKCAENVDKHLNNVQAMCQSLRDVVWNEPLLTDDTSRRVLSRVDEITAALQKVRDRIPERINVMKEQVYGPGSGTGGAETEAGPAPGDQLAGVFKNTTIKKYQPPPK